MAAEGGESLKESHAFVSAVGIVRLAELHWYEASGVGKREIRTKRYLD